MAKEHWENVHILPIDKESSVKFTTEKKPFQTVLGGEAVNHCNAFDLTSVSFWKESL